MGLSAHAPGRHRRVVGVSAGGALLASFALVATPVSAAFAADQPVLETRSAEIITVGGLQFRDLDGSGDLTPYEDWRLAANERAADLVGRLDLEQRAGLLMHASLTGNGTYDRAAFDPLLEDKHITTYISRLSAASEVLANQHNQLQEAAEGQPFGIPLKISTDPRNGFSVTEGQTVSNGDFTPFPDAIGMGAIGDPETTRNMGEIIRREYRAVGISEALSPQADIATEPRWTRINGTFGSVGATVKNQVRAYVEGLQGGTSGITADGVATVVKHWVGYGAQANGYDSHYYYGRYATFPGNNFDEHITPFEGAFDVNAAGVMPTYSILQDLERDGEVIEQVGANHNEYLLQDLLRDQYGFDGVITSDWGIANDCPAECMAARPPASFVGSWGAGMPWGVEDLTLPERYASAVNAGVDIIGGSDQTQYIIQAVDQGFLTETRINEAAERVLSQKFELGLFENPYVDPVAAEATVGSAESRATAISAQERSLTLLSNNDDALPITAVVGTTAYLSGVDADAAVTAGLTPVTDVADADIAIVRLTDPRGGSDLTDLNFAGTEPDYVALKAAHDAGALTIAVPQLSRPLVLNNVVENSDAVLGAYGVSDEALLNVIVGNAEPEGRLPFELPSSMDEVAAQFSDVSNDTANPLFEYGSGLNYAVDADPTDPTIPADPTEPAPAPTDPAPTPAPTDPAPVPAPAPGGQSTGGLPSGSADSLANTGATPRPYAAWAGTLLALGAALFLVARRRPKTRVTG